MTPTPEYRRGGPIPPPRRFRPAPGEQIARMDEAAQRRAHRLLSHVTVFRRPFDWNRDDPHLTRRAC